MMNMLIAFSKDSPMVPHVLMNVNNQECLDKWDLDMLGVLNHPNGNTYRSMVVDKIRQYYKRKNEHVFIIIEENGKFIKFSSDAGVIHNTQSTSFGLVDETFDSWNSIVGSGSQYHLKDSPKISNNIVLTNTSGKHGNYSIKCYASESDTIPVKLNSVKIDLHNGSYGNIYQRVEKERPQERYKRFSVIGYGAQDIPYGIIFHKKGENERDGLKYDYL